ncbi:condensation domain-containing protein [Streptomyces sp. TR06-5]|uniref:condensation domain-containing protein n=1 Tax=unclassified Streptomyces TaxID=2593676 RepID=UPI0039A070E5
MTAGGAPGRHLAPAPVPPADPGLAELVGMLRVRDVRVRADGDALHYDAPPEAVTDDLLERIREHKTELLEWLASGAGGPEVESSGPATYFQRRMHAQHSASRLPAGLNVAQRIELDGPLDPEVLARAFTALTARQATLRSRLVRYGPELVQEVLPVRPVSLPVADLSSAVGATEEAAAEWLVRHTDEPFELSVAPLWRAALLRRGERAWTLALVVHHIVIDGWGLDVLLRDLAAFFAAARELPAGRIPTGAEAGLAPLAASYPEIGRWQRAHLSGPRLRELRDHWSTALDGAPLRLNLPTDRPRPERHSNRGAGFGFEVGPALAADVEALARARGTTVFTVMLGVYGSLLCRLTGQAEVVVACNIANRVRREHEDVVGPFTNNVPLRLGSGGGNCRTAIDAAARTFFAAASHQDYPMAMLVEDLAARGTAPGERFPQALIVMQNQAAPELVLPEVDSEVHDVAVDGMRSELCLILVPEADRIRCLLRYARDLFDPGTVERWAESYVALLKEAVSAGAGD